MSVTALLSRFSAPRASSAPRPALAGLLLLGLLALFFGLASALLPYWFVLSALLVPTVAILMLVWPELGLTALIALTCGLIHPAFVPRVPMLGGSVAASDAVLVMLAAYATLKLATQKRKSASAASVKGAGLLAAAFGLFGVFFVASIVMSLWVKEVNPTWVLGEARRLLYLTALPIAIVILQTREKQKRLVVSLVVLGCLFSVGQIFQGVFNIQVFGDKGRMVVLETLGRQDHGTTRSLTLGIEVIVYALLLTIGAHVLGAIGKRTFFAVSGLLVTGIFLSFGRTTFAVALVCVLLVVMWLNLRKLPQLIGFLVLLVALTSVFASIWKPDYLASVYYRITSINTEVASGDSAQWRYWEAEEIVPHIQKYPFSGLGLGADYKKANRSTADLDLNRYIHNAYLYMAGKMGIPALCAFLAAMFAVLTMGRRTAKTGGDHFNRIVGAASASMMISFLLASVTEPHFMMDYSLVVIAIAAALVYLVAQNDPGLRQVSAKESASRFHRNRILG
jgi:O-antigen ligase